MNDACLKRERERGGRKQINRAEKKREKEREKRRMSAHGRITISQTH